jgi:hypothetical protein
MKMASRPSDGSSGGGRLAVAASAASMKFASAVALHGARRRCRALAAAMRAKARG